jgi:hypothetical protein
MAGKGKRTEYTEAQTDPARRELANKIAGMRKDGVPWDGPEGIVARNIVASATQGRALLRRYDLVEKAGGIGPSYDRAAHGLTGPRKSVPVRVPPDLVARIDAARGLVPREPYVRDLLDKALRAEERKGGRR